MFIKKYKYTNINFQKQKKTRVTPTNKRMRDSSDWCYYDVDAYSNAFSFCVRVEVSVKILFSYGKLKKNVISRKKCEGHLFKFLLYKFEETKGYNRKTNWKSFSSGSAHRFFLKIAKVQKFRVANMKMYQDANLNVLVM